MGTKRKTSNKSNSSILMSGDNVSVSVFGFGVAPVGSVVAWNGGYYTGTDNTGFVNFINGGSSLSISVVNKYLNPLGFAVCDGSAPNDPSSPIWNTPSRYLPNISDERFLRGSSSIAATASGSNTMTDHAHSHTVTLASSTHTHFRPATWSNDASNDWSAASGNGDGSQNTYSEGVRGVTGWNYTSSDTAVNPQGTHRHMQNHATTGSANSGRCDVLFSGGSPVANNAYSTGGTTGDGWASHVHTYNMMNHRHWIKSRYTTSGTSHTHAFSASGTAPSLTDNRPKYMKCFMIVRIS